MYNFTGIHEMIASPKSQSNKTWDECKCSRDGSIEQRGPQLPSVAARRLPLEPKTTIKKQHQQHRAPHATSPLHNNTFQARESLRVRLGQQRVSSQSFQTVVSTPRISGQPNAPENTECPSQARHTRQRSSAPISWAWPASAVASEVPVVMTGRRREG